MQQIEELISTKYSFSNNESSLKEFLRYEFYFLSGNKSLNPNKFNSESSISFLEFQNYFSYPMIFTQCLFNSLALRKIDVIEIDDYINGFLTIYTGQFEKRIKFIFNMFNINKDGLIHYEDVKQVLNYFHIFSKKKNIETLNKIIDNFFKPKKEYTKKEFSNIIAQENSDLFFLILSMIFEKKTFTNELLNAIKDEDIIGSNIEKNNFQQNIACSPMNSKKCSKFITAISESNYTKNLFFNKSSSNQNSQILTPIYKIIEKGKLPKQECIDYILENFNTNLVVCNISSTPKVDSINKNFANNQNLLKYCNCNQSPLIQRKIGNILTVNSMKNYDYGSKQFSSLMKNSLLLQSYSCNKNKNNNSNDNNKYICTCYSNTNNNSNNNSNMNNFNNESGINSINIINCDENEKENKNLNKKSVNDNEDKDKDKDKDKNSGEIENENENEDDKELEELDNFENDYINTKHKLGNICQLLIKSNLPKLGSACHVLENGVFISKMNSDNSTKYENSSILSINISNGGGKRDNNKSGNILKKSSFCSANANINAANNKNNNILGANPNENCGCNNSFNEYLLNNSHFQNDYEEDIYMLNSKNTIMKKYSIIICKNFNFILIVKKKNDNIIIFTSPKENYSNSNKECKFLDLKCIIPFKKLYIKTINEDYEFNNIKYYQINLVNTILYKRRKYTINFEKSCNSQFIKFKNLFITMTNYSRIQDSFISIKEIGKGSFGQMLLMKHKKTDRLYAIKKLNKKVLSIEAYMSLNWERDIETFIMNNSSISENLLKCYKILETLDHIYFVTEYIKNGSLSNYLKKCTSCLSSSTVLEIIKQISLGIKDMHKYGIMHRDLKFENLLVDYDKDPNVFTVKVIDFGLSKVVTPLASANEPYGTLLFSSPEILLNMPYDFRIDTWSIGIITYYLEYAFMPFNVKGKEKNKEIINKIVFKDLELPHKSDCNSQNDIKAHECILCILKNCLNKEIKFRVNIYELIDIINN